jgi:hypothetical protein
VDRKVKTCIVFLILGITPFIRGCGPGGAPGGVETSAGFAFSFGFPAPLFMSPNPFGSSALWIFIAEFVVNLLPAFVFAKILMEEKMLKIHHQMLNALIINISLCWLVFFLLSFSEIFRPIIEPFVLVFLVATLFMGAWFGPGMSDLLVRVLFLAATFLWKWQLEWSEQRRIVRTILVIASLCFAFHCGFAAAQSAPGSKAYVENGEKLSVDEACKFLENRHGQRSGLRDYIDDDILQQEGEKAVNILVSTKGSIDKRQADKGDADRVMWSFIAGEKGGSFRLGDDGFDGLVNILRDYFDNYISGETRSRILGILSAPYPPLKEEGLIAVDYANLNAKKALILRIIAGTKFPGPVEDSLILMLNDDDANLVWSAISILGKNKSVKGAAAFGEIIKRYMGPSKATEGYRHSSYDIRAIIRALENYDDPETSATLRELSKNDVYKGDALSALSKRADASVVPELLAEFEKNKRSFFEANKDGFNEYKSLECNSNLSKICRKLSNFKDNKEIKKELYEFITSDYIKYQRRLNPQEGLSADFAYYDAIYALASTNGIKELLNYLNEYKCHEDYVRDWSKNIVQSIIYYSDYKALSIEDKELLWKTFSGIVDDCIEQSESGRSIGSLGVEIMYGLVKIPDDRAQELRQSLERAQRTGNRTSSSAGAKAGHVTSGDLGECERIDKLSPKTGELEYLVFDTERDVQYISSPDKDGFKFELPDDTLILLENHSGFARVVTKQSGKPLYFMDFEDGQFIKEKIKITGDDRYISFVLRYGSDRPQYKTFGPWRINGFSRGVQYSHYILDTLLRKVYKIR